MRSVRGYVCIEANGRPTSIFSSNYQLEKQFFIALNSMFAEIGPEVHFYVIVVPDVAL